jgi:hypothetical protein
MTAVVRPISWNKKVPFMTPGHGPPSRGDDPPEGGRPAGDERSRWRSVVGHGAEDVVVAVGGNVPRNRRFLDRDLGASGDVEAAADAFAVAGASAGPAAEGQVTEDPHEITVRRPSSICNRSGIRDRRNRETSWLARDCHRVSQRRR